MEIIVEKLLFAAHGGIIGDERGAIIMDDHCLPIACSRKAYDKKGGSLEGGIHSCWESCCDAEEFFEYLGIAGITGHGCSGVPPKGWKPEGLWVYDVSYDESEIDFDELSHLRGGSLRRPTVEELRPLAVGLAPWDGVVL
jgi:hypothetical protein